MSWQPGDRVRVLLPDRTRPYGIGYQLSRVAGTVREVDPPGLPPGVRVDLDEVVNGIRECFATHNELERGDD